MSDLIIGLPSIQFYDLMPIFNRHLATKVCCEICAIPTQHKRQTGPIVATVTFGPTGHIQGDAHSAIVRLQYGPFPILLPPHHSTYMDPMVAELHAIADTTYLPTYTDPLQLAQAMHALHMSNMLGYDGAEMRGLMI